jgi:hypothetical protein
MHKQNKKYLISIMLTLACLAVSAVGRVYAANDQAAVQGYGGSSQLQPGMIVRLSSTNPKDVAALNYQDASKMLGVAVSANEAAITISQPNISQEIYVANSGVYNVLVSDQNGPINVGDYISISSLDGIGMKADSSDPVVLGQAMKNFNGSSNVLSNANLKGSNSTQTVAIGLIPVNINIINNPLANHTQGIPAPINKIVHFVTNKSVSAIRVYLSLMIVLIGATITIATIYSGVKNGIVSLGRNPLAKSMIVKGMLRVIAIGILIFSLSLGGAYLLLR